jgi:hypothetical protein
LFGPGLFSIFLVIFEVLQKLFAAFITPEDVAGESGLVLENEGDLRGVVLGKSDAEKRAGDEEDGSGKLHSVVLEEGFFLQCFSLVSIVPLLLASH